MKLRCLLSLLFCVQLCAASTLKHIEPAFWWVGMKHHHLQILVHGTDIGAADVVVDTPGVSLNRVVRTDSQNYLFIYVDISSSAKAGSFDITLVKDGETLETFEYPLLERKDDRVHLASVDNSDVIYLLMPDRFANGDPSNDVVLGMRESEVDRLEPYGRHGGDIQGMIDQIDYLHDLGVSTVWPNPLLENDQLRQSYHGYAATDFYAVDRRFGSNELLLKYAELLNEKGMKLIMDVVLNHCGDEHWWMEDKPTSDWINLGGKFKPTNHYRMTNYDSYASEVDKKLMREGWFVKTMPDLNLKQPLLLDYMIQNSIWWIEYLGLEGIRVDTYPYPDRDASAKWCEAVLKEYPGLLITGEEWTVNPVILSTWQAGNDTLKDYDGKLPSLLDFPIQDAVKNALIDEENWGSGLITLYEMLSMDIVYKDPNILVTFLSNHDMPRFFMEVGKDIDWYKNGLVFLLTTRGIPHLFYGDEILMTHDQSDGHGHIRKDFPGGWDGDPYNAFKGEGLSKLEQDAFGFTQKLLQWRKQTKAIHSGKLKHFGPRDSCYVYFRYNDESMVMIVINKNPSEYELELGRFAEMIHGKTSAINVLTGATIELGKSLKLSPKQPLVLEIR